MSYLNHRSSTISPDIKIADGSGTQNVFSQIVRQITESNKNIFDDLKNLDSRSNGVVYFGDPNTNGTWRITISGANLAVQLLTGGVWVEKALFTP